MFSLSIKKLENSENLTSRLHLKCLIVQIARMKHGLDKMQLQMLKAEVCKRCWFVFKHTTIQPPQNSLNGLAPKLLSASGFISAQYALSNNPMNRANNPMKRID